MVELMMPWLWPWKCTISVPPCSIKSLTMMIKITYVGNRKNMSQQGNVSKGLTKSNRFIRERDHRI